MKPIVLEVIQGLGPGGLERLVLEMLRCAPPHVDMRVVSLYDEGDLFQRTWPDYRHLNGNIVRLGKTMTGIDLVALYRLARLFRSIRPVAVHTHHFGPLFYGGIAGKIAGVPAIVHTEHDADHLGDRSRRRRENLLLKFVQPTVVADAHNIAAALQTQLGGVPIRVIQNGIDTETFSPADKSAARKELGIPDNGYVLGCAARLEPVKAHENIIRALSSLPSQVHLVLAGSGSLMSELKALAASVGVESRVQFLGAVSNMPHFYSALDRFCLASHKEGFPLSVLEAQSCGVPAIATDVGGVQETLCPKTGVLVPPNDVPALVKAIGARLVQTEPTAGPREYVRGNHDIHGMINSYLSTMAIPTIKR